MAPMHPATSSSRHAFNHTSNGPSRYGDVDGFSESESMVEESEMLDVMDGSALVLHDDMTLDDLDQVDMYESDMQGLGPEVEQFAEYLDSMRTKITAHPGDKAISERTSFELIETYRQIARKRLEEQRKALRDLEQAPERREMRGGADIRDASGQYVDVRRLKDNYQEWEVELQTWDLLSLLSKHRMHREGRFSPENIPSDVDKRYSDLKLKEQLMLLDPQFKELNIILHWLQKYAPPPNEVDYTQGQAGWSYTKQLVKNLKSNNFPPLGGIPENIDLVTELDPDAPTRQGKSIKTEDACFEEDLMAVVFQHLRGGDVLGAMGECRELKQHWRAQTLAGGFEAWDEAVDGPKAGVIGLEGNRRRELWRRMCYNLATKTTSWESAVYGLLAGDLESVLPMCETWEDHLHAHLSSLIETQYYNYLAVHQRIPATLQKFPIYDAVQHHGGHDARFLSRIIDTLKNTDVISAEAHSAQREVQGSLLSERVTDILVELSRQLELFEKNPNYEPSTEDRDSKGLNIFDFRLLRVVVHIVLVLKSLGAGFATGSREWQYAEDVVAGYMDVLATSGKFDLVPLYAGQISKERASKVMGKILVKVTSEPTRMKLLGLMKSYDIDIPETLKQMISIVFELTSKAYLSLPLPNWTGILSPRTTGINNTESLIEEDEILIRALEWLLLVPEMKGQMMQDGCIVYKRFLLTGKLAAAKELYYRIPSTIVFPKVDPQAESVLKSFDTMDTDSEGANSALRRADYISPEHARQGVLYMEFEMFIKSIMELEEWKIAVHKVSGNKRDHVSKSELERAYESVQSYILPIPKNWLVPSINGPWPEDEVAQLRSIRNTYIPDLVLALHNVYVEAGKYLRKNLLTQALELAAIVGSNGNEGREIVRCLVETGKLKEYVDSIAEVSKMILGTAQVSGREAAKKAPTGRGGGGALQIWNVQ